MVSEGPGPSSLPHLWGMLTKVLVPPPEDPFPRLLLGCALKAETAASTLDSACYMYAEAW